MHCEEGETFVVERSSGDVKHLQLTEDWQTNLTHLSGLTHVWNYQFSDGTLIKIFVAINGFVILLSFEILHISSGQQGGRGDFLYEHRN